MQSREGRGEFSMKKGATSEPRAREGEKGFNPPKMLC